MRVSLIVAMSENQVIGCEGALPWRLSTDLRRFRRLTMGHSLLMGRRTFEAIGRALPGRTSVVVTHQADYQAHGAVVAHSLDDALQAAAGESEVFVIGGEQIYRLALPVVTRIYLTLVHAEVEGDAVFPALDLGTWVVREETRHVADARNQYDHTFRVLERRSC